MSHDDSRAYLAPGAFVLAAVVGLLVWLLVLAVAGPETGSGGDVFSSPLLAHAQPAVAERTGRAAITGGSLWLHLLVTAMGFFLAGLVMGTAMRRPSPPPIAYGLAAAPVLLPLIFLLVPVSELPFARARSANFRYYALVLHAVFGAATFFPAWGGARLAELRYDLLHRRRRKRVRRAAS